MTKSFTFDAQVWLYSSEKSAWHFITVPTDVGKEIIFYFGMIKKGWGSLPVQAAVGETTWKTSIFPDKQSQSYLLPLKAEVRAKEQIKKGDSKQFTITLMQM